MAAARQAKTLKESIEALHRGGKQARLAAIHALGRVETAASVRALVSVLEDKDADVRALAVGKLVFIGGKGLVPVFVKALDDREPRVRQHALYALERLKARSAADRIAALLVGDRNELVRFNAALALAATGTRRHKAAFVKALGDRNTNVVITSLQTLASLAPREVSTHIVRLVNDARRWGRIPQGQRDVTLRLLKDSLGKKDVLRLLRKIVADAVREAERTGSPSFSMEATEAACLLAEVGDDCGMPMLLACLRGGEYAQERASAALARLKARSAVPAIIAGPLQNGFYPIKLKAIRALGEIGDPRALPALALVFNDRVDDFPVDRSVTYTKDDPELRLTVLAATAKIAAASLRQATRSGDAFERKLARCLLSGAADTE